MIIGAAHFARVIDNSGPISESLSIVLEAEDGLISSLAKPSPGWLTDAFQRWRAPLRIGSDLRGLVDNPQTFFAEALLRSRRA